MPAPAADAAASAPVANRRRGLLFIHTTALLVGMTGLFGKLLTLPPAVITSGRTFFASATLALVAWGTGVSLRVQKRDLPPLILSGFILAVSWLSFFQSVQVSTVGTALLAIAAYPLFVTFLEPLFFRERLHLRDLLVASVVVAGLVLVTPSFDLSNRFTQGILWGVLAAFAYALLTMLSRSAVARYPSVTVTFHQQFWAAVFSSPALAFSGAKLTSTSLLLLLLLGVIFTALAQGLLVASLRHIRAQTASVVIGLEPLYGIVFAFFLLDERPTWRMIAGGALILGAVFWASRAKPH